LICQIKLLRHRIPTGFGPQRRFLAFSRKVFSRAAVRAPALLYGATKLFTIELRRALFADSATLPLL
jgi:hypothetical protein